MRKAMIAVNESASSGNHHVVPDHDLLVNVELAARADKGVVPYDDRRPLAPWAVKFETDAMFEDAPRAEGYLMRPCDSDAWQYGARANAHAEQLPVKDSRPRCRVAGV